MSIVLAFWQMVDERRWDAVGALVADDVEATWPQSRERCRGREALLRFLREFPGAWRVEVAQAYCDDETGGASLVDFTVDDETVQGATFFRLDGDGRIASLVEFWPEPYEPPDRNGTLERY